MGFISRMAGTALLIGGMVGVYQYLKVHYAAPTLDLPPGITSLVAAESERLRRDGAEHFSPGENLERFELGFTATESNTNTRRATPPDFGTSPQPECFAATTMSTYE